MALVRFENVGLRYGLGPEVLRDLSFRIEPHSFQFLTGPSGAGKTSLLKLLFLSLKPTRGLITQFGHDVATLNRDALATLRRRIGIVFQDFRLLDHMTTYENVALPLRVLGRKEEESDGVPVLTVEGVIVSQSNKPVEVPRIRFAVRNATNQEIYGWTTRPTRSILEPGGKLPFRSRLASPPAEASDVMVRFGNANDAAGEK